MRSFSYYYQAIIVPLSILIPLVTACIRWRVLTPALKAIVVYLVISGSINLAAILHHGNNLPFLHVYTVVEAVCLTWYFTRVAASRFAVRAAYFMLLAFPLLCVINVVFFQSAYRFNSYVRSVEAIVLSGFSVHYFFKEPSADDDRNWASYPDNWVITGIFIYFSTCFIQFLFSNVTSVVLSHEIKMLILNMHDTLVIAMYVLIAIGIKKCSTLQTIFTS